MPARKPERPDAAAPRPESAAGSSTATADSTATDASVLDLRYGRTPRRGLRHRWFAITVAGVFVVVLSAWLVWAGLFGTAAQLEAVDTGHVIVSDSLVTVRFDVTVDPGAKVGCAIEALNESFTVVGWVVIHLPVSTDRTRSFSQDVRTSEQAVTGLIYRCWLE